MSAAKKKEKPDQTDDDEVIPDDEIDQDLDCSGETAYDFNTEVDDEPDEELTPEGIAQGVGGLVDWMMKAHPEWFEDGFDPDSLEKAEEPEEGEEDEEQGSGQPVGENEPPPESPEDMQKVADAIDRLDERLAKLEKR